MIGCEPDQGSAERMGKRVDEAVEKTEDAIQCTAAKPDDKLEHAGDKALDANE